MYLLSIAVAAAVISWVTIVVTHLKFRKYCVRENHPTKFHALLYPMANYICLAFLAGVILLMTQIPDMQLAVLILPIWLIVLWIGYSYKKKKS